jgi:hypothetical protein
MDRRAKVEARGAALEHETEARDEAFDQANIACRPGAQRVLRSVRWIAIATLGVLCLGGCERRPTSDRLVRLDDVEVTGEAGEVELIGSDFPAGRACELSADGSLFVAGAAARPFQGQLPCRAHSERAAGASLAPWLEQIQGPAWFEGRLSVTFTDDAARSSLRGTLAGARLRLMGHGAHDPATILARDRSARVFRRELGVREVETRRDGLALVKLDPAGPAAQAGCREGDLVTRLNGAPVESPGDFSAASEVRKLELELRHPPGLQPRRLEIRLTRGTWNPPLEALSLLVALGVIAAFMLPSRPAPSSAQGLRKLAASALLGGLLLAASMSLAGALDARVLWAAPALLYLAALALAWRRHRIGSHAALRHLSLLGCHTLAVSALGLAGGSLQVTASQLALQTSPFDFLLCAQPLGWLASLILVAPDTRIEREPLLHRPLQLMEAARLTSLVAFSTAPATWVGCLWMLGLALCLGALELPRLLPGVRVGLALLALPLALIPGASLGSGLGSLIGAGLLGLGLGLVLRRALNALPGRPASAATPDPALSPFL